MRKPIGAKRSRKRGSGATVHRKGSLSIGRIESGGLSQPSVRLQEGIGLRRGVRHPKPERPGGCFAFLVSDPFSLAAPSLPHPSRNRLVPDSESPLNPYAPSAIPEDASQARRWARGLNDAGANHEQIDSAAATTTLGRTVARWLAVCSLSAIPSFVFGMIVTNNQIAGMVVGILIFVVGYSWLDFQTASRPWRRNRRIRRTLRISYGTRIAISILFPIGGFLDAICGAFTLGITAPLTGVQPGVESIGFFGALLATLVQGCILNVVLGLYALLVYLVQIVIGAIWGTKPPAARSA